MNGRSLTLFAIAAPMAATTTLASAQITPSGKGFLLRVHYAKGEILRYKSSNALAQQEGGKPLSVNAAFVIKVLDIRKGKAQLQLLVGTTKPGGGFSPATKLTVWVDNRNGSDSGTGSMLGAMPEKPVRMRQMWASRAVTLPMGLGTGSASVQSIYRFQGIRTENGRKVASVEYFTKGAAEGHGVMTLLVSDGTMLSNKAQIRLKQASGPPLEVDTTMTRM